MTGVFVFCSGEKDILESRLADVEKTISQQSTAKEELDTLRAFEGERVKRLLGFAHSLAVADS